MVTIGQFFARRSDVKPLSVCAKFLKDNMMKRYLIILMMVFIAATTLHGQTLENIKLDNKQSILNDKAFFYFPAEAKNEKRGVGIMSADPNENEETRIVFDKGDMRLVFFAQELFALADNDLFQTLSKEDEAAQSKTQIFTDKDGLFSILSTPTQFDPTKSAILVNSLVVKTQENTLFRISAYINPGTYKMKDQYQKLTENVFSTLSKGTREINRDARQEKHEVFGSKKSLAFDLPPNYCVTVDQQYDFQVFKIHRYQRLADPTWIQILIYNGHHPSVTYRRYGLSEKDGKKIKGKFLDQKIDWLFFDMNQEGFYDKEQQVTCNNVAKGRIFHIAMLSNKKGLLDDLTKIVESIKLTE